MPIAMPGDSVSDARGAPRGATPTGILTAALRSATPRALAVLARRTGDFDDAEDALQEAVAAAVVQWPREGIPAEPAAWLVRVGSRRFVDAVRSNAARRDREDRAARLSAREGEASDRDDTLRLFLLCCHPALPRASQVALTLRCIGGLTTREIARGVLSTEATIAQRISRAKTRLRGLPFDGDGSGGAAPLGDRVPAVLEVLALLHTEAHTAAGGANVSRGPLGAEALRIARMLLALGSPADEWYPEAAGLVVVMLLTDARAPARTDAEGMPIPLELQDRALWRADLIAEGLALLQETLALRRAGRLQVRAAIAAVHAEAARAEETDWREILGLYEVLCRLDPGPTSALGHAVARGEVEGPDAGLAALGAIDGDGLGGAQVTGGVGVTGEVGITGGGGLTGGVPAGRVAAVRAHLLARAGRGRAAAAYGLAARLSGNEAERRWLRREARGHVGEK